MNSTRGVPCRVRIVGLGSPFGDDRGGWEVVDQLRGALPLGGRAETVSDPLAVLDCPLGCELLVVIDVCRGAGSAGSCHRFVWPDPRLIAGGGVSSHGIGLASALELAAALGQLPPRVIVFAIEGDSAEPGANLSQVIKTAVPEIVSRVLAEFADNSDVPLRSPE